MGQKVMRAKMKVTSVERNESFESLKLSAVCKPDGYPADGSDEDNSFARWTPTAELSMAITNPELFGKIQEGQKFYVDFTLAE